MFVVLRGQSVQEDQIVNKQRKEGKVEETKREKEGFLPPILAPSLFFPAHLYLHRLIYLNAGTGSWPQKTTHLWLQKKRGIKSMAVLFNETEQASLFCHTQT